jgi:hypothetical protein
LVVGSIPTAGAKKNNTLADFAGCSFIGQHPSNVYFLLELV